MLHEATFPATCNTTNVAVASCEKNSRVTPQLMATCNAAKCCTTSCKKSRTVRYFLTTLRDNLLCVTCQPQLATQLFRNQPIRTRVSLSGNSKIIIAKRARSKNRMQISINESFVLCKGFRNAGCFRKCFRKIVRQYSLFV